MSKPNGPLVDTEVAAVAAGVAPATIRDWARRGLLRRRGGSERRPKWDLREVRAARDADKPRRPT